MFYGRRCSVDCTEATTPSVNEMGRKRPMEPERYQGSRKTGTADVVFLDLGLVYLLYGNSCFRSRYGYYVKTIQYLFPKLQGA